LRIWSVTSGAADPDGALPIWPLTDALLYLDDAHGFGVIGQRSPSAGNQQAWDLIVCTDCGQLTQLERRPGKPAQLRKADR
jgi:hypothetical protein